ncbi:MAG: hypothetical protein K2R93_15140 [Gemmatimonadaceae bacterium]|nr:hypothetical protein [Gemmatimonadaceae bacterium]
MHARAILLVLSMASLTAYMATQATPVVAVNIAGANDVAQQHLLSPARERLRVTAAASIAPTLTPPPAPTPTLGYEEQRTVDLLRLKLQTGPSLAVRGVTLSLHPDTILICGEYRRPADSTFVPFARVNTALFVSHEPGGDSDTAHEVFARCAAPRPTR